MREKENEQERDRQRETEIHTHTHSRGQNFVNDLYLNSSISVSNEYTCIFVCTHVTHIVGRLHACLHASMPHTV